MKTTLVLAVLMMSASQSQADIRDYFTKGVSRDTLADQTAFQVTEGVDSSGAPVTGCFSTDSNGNFYRATTVGSNCTGAVKRAHRINNTPEAFAIKHGNDAAITYDGYTNITGANGAKFYAKKNADTGTVEVVSVVEKNVANDGSKGTHREKFETVSTVALNNFQAQQNNLPAGQAQVIDPNSPAAAPKGDAAPSTSSQPSDDQAATTVTGSSNTPPDTTGMPHVATVDTAPATIYLPPKPAPALSTTQAQQTTPAKRHHTVKRSITNTNDGSTRDHYKQDAARAKKKVVTTNSADYVAGSCDLNYRPNGDISKMKAYCTDAQSFSCGKKILKDMCHEGQYTGGVCDNYSCTKAFQNIDFDPEVNEAKKKLRVALDEFGKALEHAQARTTGGSCVKLPEPGNNHLNAAEFIYQGWTVGSYAKMRDDCEAVNNTSNPSPGNGSGAKSIDFYGTGGGSGRK